MGLQNSGDEEMGVQNFLEDKRVVQIVVSEIILVRTILELGRKIVSFGFVVQFRYQRSGRQGVCRFLYLRDYSYFYFIGVVGFWDYERRVRFQKIGGGGRSYSWVIDFSCY